MSDFNLAELLPFYLDETDEHIAALNDALLRLEQDPTDARALQEAFRMFHSIKGASVVMGFKPVNQLTHHLESLYEQLRSKKRELDRSLLDLTFRCLDDLRDYHRDLRAHGQSDVDLSKLTAQVVEDLQATTPAKETPESKKVAAEQAQRIDTSLSSEAMRTPIGPPEPVRDEFPDLGIITLVVTFQANLPLADMKARLILNRLASKSQILASEPLLDDTKEIESLQTFTIYLRADATPDELYGLADVEGVENIKIYFSSDIRLENPITEPVAEPYTVHMPIAPVKLEPQLKGTEAAQASIMQDEFKEMPGPISEAIHPKTSTKTRKAKVAETIRVDSDRLDHLMNLAGELVITKARFVAIARSLDELFRGSNARTLTSDTHERLESLARGIEAFTEMRSSSSGTLLDRWSVHMRQLRDNFRAIHGELNLLQEAREQLKSLTETIHSLGRVSDGLQKGVLDTRMVPIGPLFERFRRVIRDLGLSSGKEVVLQISGEKTELDKRMIDELSDPLIHMVRNAVDHGLELPHDREAVKKPRAGTISLLASHRGNSVVITVSDDGQGINYKRLRNKIVSKGLLSESAALELTDQELVTFIWHPGLSTAETITEISGRGVGMDIVKSRIENLSGTVEVRSVAGQGTIFTIRLPLTLAIMSSLLVRIYDEIYAIPLDHIDEIVEVYPHQIYRIQGRPAIEIRKKIVALIALADVFHWPSSDDTVTRKGMIFRDNDLYKMAASGDKQTVVIIQNGETTIGLLVDQLIGMQEVVLKSLEKNFQTVPGLSGASILGDGRVSLILDLDAVLDMVSRSCEHRHGENAVLGMAKERGIMPSNYHELQ